MKPAKRGGHFISPISHMRTTRCLQGEVCRWCLYELYEGDDYSQLGMWTSALACPRNSRVDKPVDKLVWYAKLGINGTHQTTWGQRRIRGVERHRSRRLQHGADSGLQGRGVTSPRLGGRHFERPPSPRILTTCVVKSGRNKHLRGKKYL